MSQGIAPYKISFMSERRELTETERQDALRLKRVFAEAKAKAKEDGRVLNQTLLAEKCGWSGQSAVSQYMTGKIPLNTDAVYLFAEALGVAPEDISPSLTKVSQTTRLSENTAHYTVNSGRIPLISWVNAGCWSEAIDLHEVGDAEDWIVFSDGSSSEGTYALTVQGESMYDPNSHVSFSQGDIIIVDPERQPENKSLVVVRQNGNMEATFKQLIVESGQKMLKALNPSWPNRIIEMNEDTVLCGVVIGKYQKF